MSFVALEGIELARGLELSSARVACTAECALTIRHLIPSDARECPHRCELSPPSNEPDQTHESCRRSSVGAVLAADVVDRSDR